MIEVILGALTAGALAVTQDTAAQVVKDAYGALVRKFGSKLDAPMKQLEEKPDRERRKTVLKEELETARVADDSEVLKLAQTMLDVFKQHGSQPGKVNTIKVYKSRFDSTLRICVKTYRTVVFAKVATNRRVNPATSLISRKWCQG